jgi:alginate O-acetyltransferase complex protein AlgI
MLFNSPFYLFVFLPLTVAVYYVAALTKTDRYRIAVLVAASLTYYAWWNPKYLIVILVSISANYILGNQIVRYRKDNDKQRLYLILGVTLNLLALGYYKYTNFILETANAIFFLPVHLFDIILPIGISFFTFQQIAFLVDCYRNETGEYNFSHYALFVTFFPQLIAGPIVHHREMMPQFDRLRHTRADTSNLAVGSTLLIFGLFKKVVIADTAATVSTFVFAGAAIGKELTIDVAWTGAVAYTVQIYFDFSGYSDMAIGSARLFGIRLPINFNSPYRSASIIDFWRRWHITLSRFLRDYLYYPLGGNRYGSFKRYRNLILVMLLGGLWHGAGWNFVIWGGLHGTYLIINHCWRSVIGTPFWTRSKIFSIFGQILTLFAVIVAWVFFRAADFTTASTILFLWPGRRH